MGLASIITQYHGPTNRRGSRVSARSHCGRVFVAYDDGKSSTDNHRAAAKALCRKFGWQGRWWEGEMPDGKGNVYVKEHADAHFEYPTMVKRINLMSGKEYWEAEDTPIYCSPASESYWSM
jgi:hypothetical protein